MGGTSTFLQLLCMIGFLSATWGVAKVSKVIGLPALVLEIGMGILLGPGVARLVGPEYAECEQRRFTPCQLPSRAHGESLLFTQVPLGPNLGRVANMDYCPRELYLQVWNITNTTGHQARRLLNSTGGASWLQSLDRHNVARDMMFGDPSGVPKMRPPVVPNCNETFETVTRNCTNYSLPAHYATYEDCLVGSCVRDLITRCENNPGLFTLIGHAGVGLILFEIGTYFSYKRINWNGLWAAVVCTIGAVVPFLTGMGLTVLYGRPIVPDGVLVGTALVPTGSTYTWRLLRDYGVMKDRFGEIILTAALFSDLLALLLYDIFFSLGGEFEGFRMVGEPIIGSILVLCTMALAWQFWPRFIQGLLPLVERMNIPRLSSENVLYFVMFGWLVFWAWILHLLGNFLWGCFMAGMSFACLENIEEIRNMWHKQTKPLTTWLLRIFFACTVGFTVQPEVMFSGEAFWKGTVMGIFMGILFKVISGLVLPHCRWTVGWAMVGRAELAFFIAQTAAGSGMMSQMAFDFVLWALLWSTVVSPFLFRLFLRRQLEKHGGFGVQDFSETKVVDVGDICVDGLEGIKVDDCSDTAVPIEGDEPSAVSSDAAVKRGSLLCCLFLKDSAPTATQ